MTPNPTAEQAQQLAIMLSAGLPARDAVSYFLPGAPVEVVVETARDWARSSQVQKAVRALQGKDWQEMTLEEKIKLSIDKHYAEMAYYLYSHNYGDLNAAEKSKADTCRDALERKIAGTSGSMDPLMSFLNDLKKGKLQTLTGGKIGVS